MKLLIKRARELGFEVELTRSCHLPNGICQFHFIVPGAIPGEALDKQLRALVNDKEICEHKRRLGCLVCERYDRASVNLRGLSALPHEWEEAVYAALKDQTNEVTREDLFETAFDCLNRINALLARIARANLTKPINGLKCAVDAVDMAHLITAQQALDAICNNTEIASMEG